MLIAGILISVSINFNGCSFFFKSVGPLPIEIKSESFILAWEAEKVLIPDIPTAIKEFNIYYRKLNSEKWKLLKTVSKDSLQTTVSIFELSGYGDYEFGVQQVYNNEASSIIHKSTDFSAKPRGGWYLVVSP